MANYYEKARSSYFKPVCREKFEKFCQTWAVTFITSRGKNGGAELVGFYSEDGLPYDPDSDRLGSTDERFFLEELEKHIAPDWVVIVIRTGSEKMRYLVGVAVAINSDGKSEEIDLWEIYTLADKLGKYHTRAES
jgi:hypothetical protein